MIASALARIEAELARLRAELDAGHTVAADDLRTAARQLVAQAEMMEQGLDQ